MTGLLVPGTGALQDFLSSNPEDWELTKLNKDVKNEKLSYQTQEELLHGESMINGTRQN